METVKSGLGLKLLREKVFQKSKAPEVIKATPKGKELIWYTALPYSGFMLFCSICNLLTTKKQEAIYQGWEQGHFYYSEILVFCSVVENKPGMIICSLLMQAP